MVVQHCEWSHHHWIVYWKMVKMANFTLYVPYHDLNSNAVHWKGYWIIHTLQWMRCMVCELYCIKAVSKKKETVVKNLPALCRRHRFNPWFGIDVVEQLILGTTTIEPMIYSPGTTTIEPLHHNYWSLCAANKRSHHNEKPEHCNWKVEKNPAQQEDSA